MKKTFLIVTILLGYVVVSCNRAPDIKTDNSAPLANNITILQEDAPDQQIPVGEQQQTGTDSIIDPAIKGGTNKQLPAPDWDKKIIKTASLKLEVTDFKKYNEIVYKTVHESGGYIAQEDQNLTAEKNEAVITIKVPVYQFEKMMNDLPGNDAKIIERKINTDDVTGKIVDTRSRLEAKKEMRLKYLEFLKQSKNMKEVLEVQAEVNNIQEEIEAAAGQVNYLSHQAALSSINLTFYQFLPGYKPDSIEKPSFLTRVSNAFKMGGSWLADVFVGLMSIWPLMLLIIASIILWRRNRTQRLLPGMIHKK